MTRANLMNVASVNSIKAQSVASKKLQEENLEVAEAFAGLMNQTMDFSNSVVDDASSNMDISKTGSKQSAAESYERYGYKDHQINSAKDSDIAEKLEESGEALEQAAEEVVDTLCEEYGVDEETVQKLLDEMGLTPLDLLNPQNLVGFLVALTGAASGEELLLDENFLKVMETLDNLAQGLMKDLGVDMEGLQALIAEMDMTAGETEVPVEFQEILDTQLENTAVENQTAGTDVESTENVDETTKNTVEAATKETTVEETTTGEATTEETIVEETTTGEAAVEDTTTEEANVEKTIVEEAENLENTENAKSTENVDETIKDTVETTTEETENPEVKMDKSEKPAETPAQDTEEIKVSQQTGEETSFTGGSQNSENSSLLNHDSDANQTVIINQTTANAGQVSDMSQLQFNSYLSADSVHIIEQIVQKVRVDITPETTSMEMQLNPENLGKVYVHISSEEGVVNAQFHATNEVVKEALEAQIATLRENLNQAGVKVDAIEVTIASHEFERNLEQNQHKPEEQVEAGENKISKRRNITIGSLDELSGLMTEEETLAAQIMKDNGNSVDLTA